MRRYCFVLPRFGEKIYGGAEALVSAIARKLAERGDEVSIFTTCAVDNRTWENDVPAGKTFESGLLVERFLVDDRNLESWIPKQIAISEGFHLSVEDQLDWLEQSVNSSALYQAIIDQKNNFDYFLFAPYLFGTTFWGSQICPEKSLLFPCLHDENYAYTDVIASMMRRVKGCLFNAQAEQVLANTLFGEIAGGEVGLGFEVSEEQAPQAAFFQENFPYVLCLGRKETGKNAQLLIDLFIDAKKIIPQLEPLKLVIAGGGSYADLFRDEALLRSDVIDLPALDEEKKQALLANALCLCNPSVNESFSIVIMEAWLQKRPVVVNSMCSVTREHAIESNGGLYFQNAIELAAIFYKLLAEPKLATSLGTAGYNYVATKYSWCSVLKRFDQVLEQIAA